MKQLGRRLTLSVPRRLRMERKSVYIQKQDKDKKTWFNLIKCLSIDAEKLIQFLSKQDPDSKFRIWTGKEK